MSYYSFSKYMNAQDDNIVSCSSCKQIYGCECLSADDPVRKLNDRFWTIAHNTKGSHLFTKEEFEMAFEQLNQAKEMFVCQKCKGGENQECEESFTDRQRIEALSADVQQLKLEIMALKEEFARLKK